MTHKNTSLVSRLLIGASIAGLALSPSFAEAGFMGVAVIEPKSVAVTPSGKVSAGAKVTIACTWKQTASVQQRTVRAACPLSTPSSARASRGSRTIRTPTTA